MVNVAPIGMLMRTSSPYPVLRDREDVPRLMDGIWESPELV
jgi:hypothetical protein